MLADGLALRFIDVVDWQGSRNSRMESNMEVAWVSRGLYLVSPERKLLRAIMAGKLRVIGNRRL